ncbi:isochorismate synthase MenF [Phenylobacterium sp. LjRoot225]|uniref:isochorismate synthase n=1 Tax=Phenylobacterium sp. LjRoot225 TaxID=3342285 RepID=UPI003ECE4185
MTADPLFENVAGWVSPLHSDFLFMSRHRNLRASGVFARITVPAAGAGHPDSLFRQAVADSFQRARRAGVRKPIMIGAIPFDQTRPTCLYIPQCHEMFERDAVPVAQAPGEPPAYAPLDRARHTPDRAGYEAAVTNAVAAIRNGVLDKAVLARVCDLKLDREIEADWVLHRLVQQNPSGFHFRVPMADGGVLVGASPELLVRKEGRRVQSNPLAGSARRVADPQQDEAIGLALQASGKDLREHAYVVEAVREALSPLCDRLDVPETPRLMTTASMWHLSTPIQGELADPAVSVLQVACRLHPTPAVCGHPTEAARALIASLEPFDRDLFAGLVGWCDAEGDGEWAVTIRCGVVRGDELRLFAGAGVVADSSPSAEWKETGDKLATMLRVFGLEAAAS